MKQVIAAVALVVSIRATASAETLIASDTTPMMACGAAGADWTSLGADERAFSPRTVVPDAGTGCGKTQLLRWRFDVQRAFDHRVVTLHARYQHGFVAYLDGVEVARRRVAIDSTIDAFASEVHGPEWEPITLPLRSLAAGPHELAVEAHPRSALREASFDATLTAGNGPTLTVGPYLVDVTTSTATIAVETDVPTTASLRWGRPDATLDHLIDDRHTGPSRMHHFVIEGLRAATRYAYSIALRAPELAEADLDTGAIDFHTMPAHGPVRFVIYGDVRSGHDVHAELVQRIRAEDPDLAIMTGDLVDMGSDEADWVKFFEIATPLLEHVPVYPAPGNHEYARAGKGAARFFALFRPQQEGQAWHSFDVAGVHFIALDSTQYRSQQQVLWLKRDLELAKKAHAIFAYAHEGPYSSGLHGDNELAKREYAPLLEHAGATLYISGHDHHYERGRVGKLDYLLSGGGGAELRTQRCGLPGKPACASRVQAIANEHNYVVVDVLPGFVRISPKRPDGSAIEPPITRALQRR